MPAQVQVKKSTFLRENLRYKLITSSIPAFYVEGGNDDSCLKQEKAEELDLGCRPSPSMKKPNNDDDDDDDISLQL